MAEESSLPPVLEVTTQRHAVTLDDSKQVLIRFWLQELMLSALYRNVIQESSLAEWQKEVASDSSIHCKYRSEAALALPERRTLNFDEVLLTLPSVGYPGIFIRRGEHVLSLSMYDPWVLHKLISECGISMYQNLSTVQRGLF